MEDGEIFPVNFFKGKEDLWGCVRNLRQFDFTIHRKETFYKLKDKIVYLLTKNNRLFMTTAPLDRKLRPILPYLFDEVLNREGDFEYKNQLFYEILKIGYNEEREKEFIDIYDKFIKSSCEITSGHVHTGVMNGDTVLSFALKYGDYTDSKFSERIAKLLRKSNRLRVNYEGRLPLDVLIFRIKTHEVFKECCLEVQETLSREDIEKKEDRYKKICDIVERHFPNPSNSTIINNVLHIIKEFKKEAKHDYDKSEEHQRRLEHKILLFECIIQNRLEEFINNLNETNANLNDGEYNLLQCSCYIPYREKFVYELIKRGASPNTNTEIPNLSKLEIARALRYPCIILAAIADLKDRNENADTDINYNKGIFDKVLQHCKLNNYELTPIDFIDMQFYKSQGTISPENFYKLTVLQIDERVFSLFTQRTVQLSDPIGLKILLNKGWSLLNEDCDKKTVLDYDVAAVLKDFMDTCIFLEDREERKLFYSHKLYLDYSFISCGDDQYYNETKVLDKMALNNTLSKLIFDHPLIDSFINIKWSMVQPFFSVFLFIKILVHILTSFYFLYEVIESKNSRKDWYWLLAFTCCLSCVLSFPLFNKPRYRNLKIIDWNFFKSSICNYSIFKIPLKFVISIFTLIIYFVLATIYIVIDTIKENNMHFVFEILGCICFVWHLFNENLTLASFSYVFMSLSLILSVGYHPKVSKVTAMLKKVYSSFFLMFLFFTSTFLISYIFGFRVIFKTNESYGSWVNATVSTFIMMAGEINANETIHKSDMWQKLFGITFIISVTIVLTNFIIAVFVEMANINKINEDYRLMANKNTLQFMKLCETYYNCSSSRMFIRGIAWFLKHVLLINELFANSMKNWSDSFCERLKHPYVFKKGETKNRIISCNINNVHLINLFEENERLKYVQIDYHLWKKLKCPENKTNFYDLIYLIKDNDYEYKVDIN